MYAEYIRLYKEHAATYGPNTAIFLMVGKFYELYDLLDPNTGEGQTSMRRAAELLNIQLSKKSADGPKKEDALFAGVPIQSLHKYAQVLTREGWTVVVLDQVKNAAEDVIDRRVSRILSPGTHVEAATEAGLAVAAIWMTPQPPPFAPTWSISIFETTTGETVSAAGAATGRTDAWNTDALLHILQIYNPREIVFYWRPCVYAPQPPPEEILRSRLSLRPTTSFYSKLATPESEGRFESQFTRHEYLRSMTQIPSMLPIAELLSIAPSSSSSSSFTLTAAHDIERSLCAVLRMIESHFPMLQQSITRHSLFQQEGHVVLGNNILEQIQYVPSTRTSASSSTSSTVAAAGQAKSVVALFERAALTPMGRRNLRRRLLNPSSNPCAIEQRLVQVDFMAAALPATTTQIQKLLRGMYDLDRLHHVLAEGTPTAQTVLELEQTYDYLQTLATKTQSTPFAQPPALTESIRSYLSAFHSTFSAEKAQRASRKDKEKEIVSFFQDSVSASLAAVEQEAAAAMKSWRALFTKFLFWTQVPQEALRLEYRDDEWSIRGSRAALQAAAKKCETIQGSPLTQVQYNARKSQPSTITCAELTKLNDTLVILQDRLMRLQSEVARDACIPLWERLTTLHAEWNTWVSTIDESQGLAAVAKEQGFTRPTVSLAPNSFLHCTDLFHPLIMNAQTRIEYVKHSVDLGSSPNDSRGWLLYGVNASGKSSLMKSIGIAVLLAQAGSYVPAASMEFAPFTSLYSRIWSHDNLWAGLSSFAVEMTELRDIVRNCNEKSLVLGDEVCSGTESESATALVGATLKWLGEKGSCYIFATHLHDLQKLPFFSDPAVSLGQKTAPRIRHLRVSIDAAGRLVYDRTLYDGAGSSQYGLAVAKAMDLPHQLLEDAFLYRSMLSGSVGQDKAQKSTWNASIIRRNCEICGHAIVRDLEVHHIQARAEGGSNQLRNLVVVCQKCHDAHHASEIQISALRQTSEGPVRSVVRTVAAAEDTASIITDVTGFTAAPATAATTTTAKKSKWTAEQQQRIQDTIQRFREFPMKRILYELEKQGVQMSSSTLKKWSSA